jgi:cell division transport system ATP-binding protein
MISFEDVSKIYSTKVFALNNVTMRVEKGEFLLITGSSGAGKSTLLKLIYGELKPSQGKVLVSGQNVQALSKNKIALLRRRMGIVFQDFRLLWNRSIIENIALPITVWNMKDVDPFSMAENIMKEFDLWKYRDLYPCQLSGGEQQKTAICRALAADPWILIADEPTGNLDPFSSTEIFDIFKESSKKGRTIVVATHNERSVSMHNGRILRLDKGKLTDL